MKNFDSVKFMSEKVKVNGPKVDGGYTITFEVGEYMQKQVAELMIIPQQTIMQVKVDYEKKGR